MRSLVTLVSAAGLLFVAASCGTSSTPPTQSLTPAGGSSGSAGRSSTGCPGAEVVCMARCIDVSADNANCGACGKVCGAGQSCSAGVCQCTGGLKACGDACV